MTTTTNSPTGVEPPEPEHADDPTEPGWALGSARTGTKNGHPAHGHPANGQTTNGQTTNGHTTNGHPANGRGTALGLERPTLPAPSEWSPPPLPPLRRLGSRRPEDGVQPEPEPRVAPAPPGDIPPHPPRQSLGATAAVVIATIVVLAGLVAWGAFDSFSSEGQTWEHVPSGQPYYVAAAKQVVVPPSIASTAKAAAQAVAAAKENPMVVTAPSTHVVLKVNPPPLGGRYAADGQIEDDFSPSYFAVPAGKTIHVTVLSYDSGYHTFTSPMLGVNVWIDPAKGSVPSRTSFTFTAPSTGYFWWLCDVPCDPYSMSRGGLMQGEIHAVKA